MSIRSKRLLGGAAALAVAAAALAACSSDSGEARGNAIVQAISGDPSTLDPRLSFEKRSAQYVANVYDTLVGFKLTKNDEGLLVADSEAPTGALAETIEVSEDKLTYTFRLHEATFHSGNPVTSADVRWSFERAWKLQEGGWFDLKTIGLSDPSTQITTPDERTAVMKMTRTTPFTLQMLANPTIAIYDSKLMKENATGDDPWAQDYLADHDAGSGPYKLESFERGVSLTLSRFDQYWGAKPEADKVVMQVVPSASDQVALLKNGDIDIAAELPSASLKELTSADGVTIHASKSNQQVNLMMNNAVGPTADVNVRRAISYAVPYDAIAANVYGGYADGPSGPIPTGMPGFDEDAALYKEDLDAAKRALAASDHAGAFSIPLTYDNSVTGYEEIAIAVQQALGKIGITVETKPVTTAQMNEAFFSGKTELFIFSALSWVNNPSYHLDLYWATGSYGNKISYTNTQVDSVKEKAFQQPVGSEPFKAEVAEIQKLMLQDAPAAWLGQVNWTLGTTDRIVSYEVRTDQIIRFGTMDLAG
ncbi:ABC transporter substrate-binding protein [Phytohabitans sp. ZYX-F-186]|uniref:ABC transporter substrate-binding protein n=1 Tax=Phytohabitans maris TaxID=3071409 RepID=A0ABU0ZPD2_9ACTN|nr:ABC transporter substrate-binding protein [Phytohabitans sp. ZYX-F-186]MDQ7908891.1 ABC transporter substrate-binding protein [Phytohabitans sp. ZYX-F-186]